MGNGDETRITVRIALDQPVLALGVACSLAQASDLLLQQGTSGSGAEVRLHQADVVITDHAQGLGLAQYMQAARRAGGRATGKVLVMTCKDREHEIRLALEAGVHGYLLSSCTPDELLHAVRTVHRGLRYICAAAAGRIAESLGRHGLTRREAEVLHLLARGLGNKHIAARLDIGIGTVKVHVKAIMAKLDATSRTHAANLAHQRGLLAAVEESAATISPTT